MASKTRCSATWKALQKLLCKPNREKVIEFHLKSKLLPASVLWVLLLNTNFVVCRTFYELSVWIVLYCMCDTTLKCIWTLAFPNRLHTFYLFVVASLVNVVLSFFPCVYFFFQRRSVENIQHFQPHSIKNTAHTTHWASSQQQQIEAILSTVADNVVVVVYVFIPIQTGFFISMSICFGDYYVKS